MHCALLVHRVEGIEGIAVRPDVTAKAPAFLIFFTGFVAGLAQALQGTCPEAVPVTIDPFDVINDSTSHDQTFFDAEGAQGMGSKLRALFFLPASEAVPVARIFRMLHAKHAHKVRRMMIGGRKTNVQPPRGPKSRILRPHL